MSHLFASKPRRASIGAPESSRIALEVFCLRVAGAVAVMATTLGGLDALVFTAGVGEGSALVRTRVCDRLRFLGVELDAGLNAEVDPDAEVAAAGSGVRVWVVHAHEDVIAARAALAVL